MAVHTLTLPAVNICNVIGTCTGYFFYLSGLVTCIYVLFCGQIILCEFKHQISDSQGPAGAHTGLC